jgi:hypothetical protein
VKVALPVPPPPTVRVPDVVGAKVRVLPEPVTVMFEVRPFVVEDEEAMVTVGPLWVWPAGPMAKLLMEEVATHWGTPLFQARTWPPVPGPKKVEVAMAETLPVLPLLFTKTVFPAICAIFERPTPLVARLRVPFAPPTSAPKVPEYENSPLVAKEEVATLWYAEEPP